MSKNTVTKKSIAEALDTVAISVAEMGGKAKITQREKLLSLTGGEKKFDAASDTEKRKLLDLCIESINDRIDTLKTEKKSLEKAKRKPLSDSPLYNGLRSLLGLACAMRSRLRTADEKIAAKKAAEKAKAENDAKILKKAIQAGKVIAKADFQSTSLEEGVLELIEIAQKAKVSLASLQDMIARRF